MVVHMNRIVVCNARNPNLLRIRFMFDDRDHHDRDVTLTSLGYPPRRASDSSVVPVQHLILIEHHSELASISFSYG